MEKVCEKSAMFQEAVCNPVMACALFTWSFVQAELSLDVEVLSIKFNLLHNTS